MENIRNELLGEGRGAFLFAAEVFEDRAGDADGIDGAVLIEPLVLAGEDGLAKVRGDLVERDERAFLPVDAANFLAEAVVDD